MKKNILPIIVIIVVLTATGFLFKRLYHYEQVKYVNSLKKVLEQQTISLSNSIWYLFNDYISDINLMSAIVARNKIPPSEKELAFLYKNTQKPQIGLINIVFLDKDGTGLAVYPKKYLASNGVNFAFRKYFQRVIKEDKPILSKPLKNYSPSPLFKQFDSFVIISPVKSDEGVVVGYLILNLDVSSLENLFYTQATSGQHSNISFFVIHSGEEELAYFSRAPYFTKLFNSNEELEDYIFKYAEKGDSIHTEIAKIAGERVLLCANHLDVCGEKMVVVAVLPYKITANYSADFSRRITLVSAYIIFMLLLVATFIIYSEIIVKRLKRKISTLEIIIDEKAKEKEMTEISESDFFKKIEDKAKSLK